MKRDLGIAVRPPSPTAIRKAARPYLSRARACWRNGFALLEQPNMRAAAFAEFRRAEEALTLANAVASRLSGRPVTYTLEQG